MADVAAALTANRSAVESLVATTERAPDRWTSPRAPGKWSPSQMVEHIARALDESANMVAGRPSKFPTLPGFLRPVARTLFFKRVLRNQAFPKARTNKAMDPEHGPATPAEGRKRLEQAVARFDQACGASAATGDGSVATSMFGRVALAEWVEFQAIHARHHEKQLTKA